MKKGLQNVFLNSARGLLYGVCLSGVFTFTASAFSADRVELLLAESAVSDKVNVVISGVVLDPAGEPMPGATISVQGTTQGTVTDIDGRYSINVAECYIGVFIYWLSNPDD
jgi:hypothetical protein